MHLQRIAIFTLFAAVVSSCGPAPKEGKVSCTADADCLDGWACHERVCTEKSKIPAGCAASNGGCDPNATCSETTGGAPTCTCKDGYTGDGKSCTAKPSCAVDNGGCDANATCTDADGAPTCTCKDGYTGDGKSCTAKPTCAVNNGGCDANATCDDASGTVACACKAGFEEDGTTCTACAATSHTGQCDGCGTNRSSWETANARATAACQSVCSTSCTSSVAAWDKCEFNGEIGGYKCTSYCASARCLPENLAGGNGCGDGGDNDSDGQADCADSDCATANVCKPSCSRNNGDCDANATCDESSGSIVCRCKSGYAGDGNSCTQCQVTSAEGSCAGCGTSRSSWEQANARATSACQGGCSSSCTSSIAAWDKCRFDEAINGYVCTSYCATQQCLPENLSGGTGCSDGTDNDTDGLTDCADPECSGASSCNP
jgi:hypothetical protein